MENTKETKEAALAIAKISEVFFKTLKDGWQASEDVSTFISEFSKPEFIQALKDGWDNLNEIPIEIKKMGLFGALEIAKAVGDELKS